MNVLSFGAQLPVKPNRQDTYFVLDHTRTPIGDIRVEYPEHSGVSLNNIKFKDKIRKDGEMGWKPNGLGTNTLSLNSHGHEIPTFIIEKNDGLYALTGNDFFRRCPQEGGEAVKIAGDMFVPANENHFARMFDKTGTTYFPEHFLEALKHVKDKRIAVDVGAHVGSESIIAADHFGTVYAFEPTSPVFNCLLWNVDKHGKKNVICKPIALGDGNNAYAMEYVPGNTGRSHIRHSSAQERSKTLRLDDLNLSSCGLIKMDVEGYEMSVLKGAEKTIDKFHPVIDLESNEHAEKFGFSHAQLVDWLKRKGYTQVARFYDDYVFVYQHGH